MSQPPNDRGRDDDVGDSETTASRQTSGGHHAAGGEGHVLPAALRGLELSVVVGLSVGILYTVGAVVTVAQLRDAGMAVRDTLPLVPLSQILGRGMSVFLKPFAGLFAIAIVVAVVIVAGPRVEEWLRARRPEWERPLRITFVVIGAGLLAAIAPWDVAIAIIVAAGVTGAVWLFVERVTLTRALLVFAALVVALIASLSFYRPEPFPTITITKNSNEVVEGKLLTTVSGRWYVAREDRLFVAVESADVRTVEIRSPRQVHRATWDVVWDKLNG